MHNQGPVVQCIVSLTSSLVIKMLTVLVSTIATHIFSAKVLAYLPYLMIKDDSFNDSLTNDIVSFEQLGPVVFFFFLFFFCFLFFFFVFFVNVVFVVVVVLSHQSPRLRMSYCDHLPSVVRPSVFVRPHLWRLLLWSPKGELFSSNSMWNLLLQGKLKICSNGQDPLIKIVAMPIYGKTLKNFSRTKKALRLNLSI